MPKVVHGTNVAETGTDITHARDNGTAGRGDVAGEEGQDDTRKAENKHKQHKKAHDATHDGSGDTLTVVLDIDDAVGMEDAFHLAEGIFEEKTETDTLEAAAGGTGTGTDKEEKE